MLLVYPVLGVFRLPLSTPVLSEITARHREISPGMIKYADFEDQEVKVSLSWPRESGAHDQLMGVHRPIGLRDAHGRVL